MSMHHQISSNAYDRYHGAAKAKELFLQKQHEHGNMPDVKKEGSRLKPQVNDSFDKNPKLAERNGGTRQPRDIASKSHSRDYDSYGFTKRNSRNQNSVHFSYENLKSGLSGMHGDFNGISQNFQFTQITVTHSVVFSGANLGSLEKSNEAHQNFLNAALDYIKNPSEQAYKSLNESMIKLMDPRFTPAAVGGAAQVSIRDVNGATMARFTMEVTPAPTKTLEEAREDLKNAFSTKRDGEEGIAGIRAEAHANYIRALSEKFKQEGVISHTNNTPTTPVFKSSVIYIAKVTQVDTGSFREIKKPDFNRNSYNRMSFKNQNSLWNDYRKNNKSYVDMLRHGSRESHIDKDSKSRRAIEARHDYRHSGEEKTGRNQRGNAKTHKAS